MREKKIIWSFKSFDSRYMEKWEENGYYYYREYSVDDSGFEITHSKARELIGFEDAPIEVPDENGEYYEWEYTPHEIDD